MTYAEKIRSKIEAVKKERSALWDKVVSSSKDYMKVLQLKDSDLEYLENLTIDVDGERFVLSAKNVCACPRGAGWQYCLLVVCESNSSLNRQVGSGTTLITTVPDEWHQKIVKHLKEKE